MPGAGPHSTSSRRKPESIRQRTFRSRLFIAVTALPWVPACAGMTRKESYHPKLALMGEGRNPFGNRDDG